jgi:hypothetical protein
MPLEALSFGTIVVLPKYREPLNCTNDKELRAKPTCQNWYTQHPFLESFVGAPKVMVIDFDDVDEVAEAAQTIAAMTSFSPFIPPRMSAAGFLERALDAAVEILEANLPNLESASKQRQ